jgi:hypothetical protein
MAEVVATNSSKDKTAERLERGRREPVPQPLASGLDARLLSLQRTVGNQAVGQLLTSVQNHSPLPGPLLQRKCASCAQGGAKCSNCREEEHLQRKPVGAGSSSSVNQVPQVVNEALGNRSGRSIDPTARGLMESRFRHDFSQVRIHHDALANRAAASVNAAAFTVGNSIWFGAGQYQTATNRGLYLLAHELAHTIQQRGQASAVQGRLNIGSVHDAAEAAADRAADAVLKNDRVPALGAASAMIRRVPLPFDPNSEAFRQAIPLVNNTDDPDTVEVQYQNNNYRVRRRVTGLRRECKTVETNESPGLSGDFDSRNVWAQVEWCTTGGRSTRGRVRFGADIPAALQQTVGRLISGGQDPRTVLNTIDLTPFLEVDIARSEQVRVRARAEATVRTATGDVRGGRGSLGVDLPGATIEFEISGTAPQTPGGRPDLQGGFKVIIPLERRSQPVRCSEVEVCTYTPVYELECVQRIPAHPVRLPDQQRFLYFEYATPIVATRDSSTGRNRRVENNRAADQNEREIPRIQQLISEGWQVSSIRGFTSPEGPRQRRRPESPFIGNQPLSENRATAAQTYIEALCNPNGALTMRRRTCFVPGVHPSGGGESLTADLPTGGEMEGTPLIEQATPRFLRGEEESHPTPELREELGTATPRQQGPLIYPLLRRAIITLTKEETIPASETESGPCSPEIDHEVRAFLDNRQQGRRRR